MSGVGEAIALALLIWASVGAIGSLLGGYGVFRVYRRRATRGAWLIGILASFAMFALYVGILMLGGGGVGIHLTFYFAAGLGLFGLYSIGADIISKFRSKP